MPTNRDHLLRAICDPANFSDDALRLAYSDELEAAGDAARAEFIREQVALAGMTLDELRCRRADFQCDGYSRFRPRCKCPPCSLRRREYESSKRHITWDWCGGVEGGWAHMAADYRKSWRRGFIHTVTCKLAEWCGGPCEGCYGSEEHGPAGHANWRRSECPHCRGRGTAPGHGKAIVRLHPVQVVELSDRRPEPHTPPTGRNFSWYIDGDDHATVPEALFDLLPDGRTGLSGRRKAYDTEADARAAISAALLAWARQP